MSFRPKRLCIKFIHNCLNLVCNSAKIWMTEEQFRSFYLNLKNYYFATTQTWNVTKTKAGVQTVGNPLSACLRGLRCQGEHLPPGDHHHRWHHCHCHYLRFHCLDNYPDIRNSPGATNPRGRSESYPYLNKLHSWTIWLVFKPSASIRRSQLLFLDCKSIFLIHSNHTK